METMHDGPWGRVACEVLGNPDGFPVVLLHGLMSDSASLRAVADALSGRFRVLLVDLPGHGRSSRPERFSYDLAARCVLSLVERLGFEGCVLCGCSLGGSVAQLCACLAEPGLVRGLHVSDAMPLDAAAYDRMQAFAVDRSTSALRVNAQRSVRPVARRLAKDLAATREGRVLAEKAISEEPLEGVLWLNKAGNETLLRFVRHSDRGFRSEVPLALAIGSKDSAVGLKAKMKAWAEVRGVALERFPGAGHLSYLDDPEGFARSIANFAGSLSDS